MRRTRGARTKALRTGMSFVLTLAMTVGSLPMDGIAYAVTSADNGAQAAQTVATTTKDETVTTTPDGGAATPDTTAAGNAGSVPDMTTSNDTNAVVSDTTDAVVAPAFGDNAADAVAADAKTEPRKVTVRFDANGGEGRMNDLVAVLDGNDWFVAENALTRDGYRFVGWSVVADVVKDAVDDSETEANEALAGVVLADRQEFVDLESQRRDEDGTVVERHDLGECVRDDVLTLYAQWEKVETDKESNKETTPVSDENKGEDTTSSTDESKDVTDDASFSTDAEQDVKDEKGSATKDTKANAGSALSDALGGDLDSVTSGAAKTSPLAKKLAAPLMAPAMGSLTAQSAPTGSRDGTAYAVLDSAGTLTFFRSMNSYTAGTNKTVKDIKGNTYTGQVYTGVENTGTRYNSAPWYDQRSSVKLARIADGQVIALKSCVGWFFDCRNMTAFEGAERLDTSAVANMSRMFDGCSAMTEPPALGSWDTGAVTYMGSMFRNCSAMTEPPAVGNWNTGAVTKMNSMFDGCSAMVEPPSVGNWDTSAVIDMSYMFNGCMAMTNPPSVGSWNTSVVTSMGYMFSGCSAMTESPAVGNWSTGAVTHMGNMFFGCSKMTSLDVSGCDFSKVTISSSYLGLQGCVALRELKVPAGAKVAGLPEHAAQGEYAATWGNAERGVTGSTAANLVSTVNAGNGAGTWKWELDGKAYAVLDSAGTLTFFRSTNSYTDGENQTVTDIKGNTYTGQVYTGFEQMDEYWVPWSEEAESIKLVRIADQQVIQPTNCSMWFGGCSNMTAFEGADRLDTSRVTDMSMMFGICHKLSNLDVSSWDTQNVTIMGQMFYECSSIGSLDVSNWDVSNVTDMGAMFYHCTSLEELDVSRWHSTRRLDINGCTNLKKLVVSGSTKTVSLQEHEAQGDYLATWCNAERGITGFTANEMTSTINAGNGAGTWEWEKLTPTSSSAYAVLDDNGTLTLFRSMNGYDTRENQTVTDVKGNTYTGHVFGDVEYSQSAPWSNYSANIKLARIADGQTIAPKSCDGWFGGCSNMTAFEGAERLDTSVVDNMVGMFANCSSMTELPAVGGWDTGAVVTMDSMFCNCSSMTEQPAIGNWDTSNVMNMSNMFSGCSKLASLDVSSWDFSKVTNSWGYLGLENCSALRELKVPAGAKIGSLPEHAAQGDYGTTWGNAERGITGSTAFNLMNTVNAGNGAGTWTWELSPRAGTAYAVLDGSGTLTFFRSTNSYTAGTGQTVTDIMGNTYTGQVYTGVETNTGTNFYSAPWYDQRSSVKLARIADGQIIAPKSCAGWFYYCSNMTAFEGAERLDTSAATSMNSMFSGCWSMIEPPAVGGWDTSKVTNMHSVFSSCSAMTVPPSVGNWNTGAVTYMDYMFSGCSKMTKPPAVGYWNTGKVTTMREMFCNCKSMTEPPSVGSWNTGAVTDMYGMFDGCSAMTEPPAVGDWDTSAVTSMGSMFYSCDAMTEPPAVGDWDTSAVTSMGSMFYSCGAMTAPPAVGGWNTSAVTNMSRMFGWCKAMTEPPAVGNWDTSVVTSMREMFENCLSITESPSVDNWNTSAVTDMSYMFALCSYITESPSVDNWNTSAVTDMSYMFSGCSKMTSVDVSGWDFSKVTNSSNYLGLQNCSALRELKVPAGAKIGSLPEHVAQGVYAATWGNAERGITGSTAANLKKTVNAGNGAGTWTWDVNPRAGTAYAVLDSAGTLTFFRSTNSYTAGANQTVTDIMGNTYTGQVYTGVENTGENYNSAPWYNQRSSVKLARIADGQIIAPNSCAGWFNGCSSMTAFDGTDRLDTSAVTYMGAMFSGCSAMVEPPAVGSWNTSAVTDMTSMFSGCSAMTVPPSVGSWDTGKVASMNSMFERCRSMTEPPAVGNWNTSEVTNLSWMFWSCSNMTVPPAVGSWDTGKVASMNHMFYDCSAMTVPPAVGSWDTSAATTMLAMFNGCSSMTEPPAVGSWNTSKVTNMGSMFQNCSSMTEPPAVGSWNTSSVTTMFAMFDNCSSMTEPPAVGSWDTSKVTNMGAMFSSCSKMMVPPSVGRWNTGAVTNMNQMFSGCSAMTVPPEVGSWNTSAVIYMSWMFGDCSAMTEPPAVSGWDTSKVTSMSSMFRGCSKMPLLDVGGWDFSKVTISTNYLGLYNCSALRELKVPAGAKITGLPEHEAQGDYAATWGNADHGVTGVTAAALVQAVNAGNGAGAWKWDLAGYIVDFSINGSSTAMPPARVKADEDYTVPNCEVTKLYYDFVEWSGSDGKTYHAGDVIPAGTFDAGDTLTLTAVFEAHEYGPGELDGNMQITVPTSINFVVDADGTLTGPTNARIENHSTFGTFVSSVEVRESGNFKFVSSVDGSSEQNVVELRFGPESNMLDAASYLSKASVGNQDAWNMGSSAGQNTVQLATEGKVAHVGADITETNKFGEVRWYVKAGA